MDWASAKQAAWHYKNSGMEEAGDCMAGALDDFIPEDQNETADWLWLKQRGWECVLETWSLPGTELNWYRGYLRCGQAQLDLDPTRMTVALFEAAMEAMKHGE